MCRRNCGGSNNLNRMKIEPRKRAASDDFISYWPKDSINWAKKIGIKTATISTCRKILISQQIWERTKWQVECVVPVLMLQTAIKLTHRKASIYKFSFTVQHIVHHPVTACRLSPTSREHCNVTLLRSFAWCLIETLFWFNSKGTLHTYYVSKQCSKYKRIWRQNMPWKQKVMFISQTSLQTSETCACVTGCTK